jgi:hypothetical protein
MARKMLLVVQLMNNQYACANTGKLYAQLSDVVA